MLRNLKTCFWRCAGAICRFSFARHGTTAVEFALIAPAFLATLIAVFETTTFLFAQQTLQSAAVTAGRLIMTGYVQNNSVTQTQFATDVCNIAGFTTIFTCSNLMINVQSYSDFSSANTTAPTISYNTNGTVSNSWTYSPGSPGQVMVVQLVYQWPIVGGPFGYVLSNLGNGTTEMMGVSAFRVEPY